MNFIHYLETISGIEIFPLISLLVFFIFFVVLFYMVMKMDKSGVDFLKNIPISDSINGETIESSKNEIE